MTFPLVYAQMNSGADVSVAGTTPGVIDASNLSVTFLAPASGAVKHTVCLSSTTVAGGGTKSVIGMMDGANAPLSGSAEVQVGGTNCYRTVYEWIETGLTPGNSYTRRPSLASFVAGGTATVKRGTNYPVLYYVQDVAFSPLLLGFICYRLSTRILGFAALSLTKITGAGVPTGIGVTFTPTTTAALIRARGVILNGGNGDSYWGFVDAAGAQVGLVNHIGNASQRFYPHVHTLATGLTIGVPMTVYLAGMVTGGASSTICVTNNDSREGPQLFEVYEVNP